MEGNGVPAAGQGSAIAAVVVASAPATKSPDEKNQTSAKPTKRPDNLAYLMNHSGSSQTQVQQTATKYIVDPQTHEVQVQIIDAETGAVVREIPPKDLAQIADSMKMVNGVLFEHRV